MSDQDSTFPGLFPDQIISEILTRLPAQDIFRFKLVSKLWNSIIHNSHFISSFLTRPFPSPNWVILDRVIQLGPESTRFHLAGRPSISSLSVDPHAFVAEPVTDPAQVKYPALILHSSNGLVLFTLVIKRDPHKEKKNNTSYFSWENTEQSLVVGNPITRQWVPLPKTRTPLMKLTAIAFLTKVGLESGVVGKFLVVEYQPIVGSNYASLMCFSSDIGKWVEKSTNYMLGMHFWRAEGSFEFQGKLFWVDVSVGLITWDVDENVDVFECLENKKKAECRFIPVPRGRAKPFNTPKLEDERCFGTGGGCIQYVEVFKKESSVLKIWRLKDYKKGDEWSLMYKVSRVDVEACLGVGIKDVMPRPCFVHPFEADTVFFENGDRIFSLNLRTREVESDGSFVGHEFVIPFVLPRWPPLLPPRLYSTYAKEEGNEFFKNQNFPEAIKCYSRSIDLSPSAAAYANRAMAYLKLSRFHDAEDDCTQALKLDGEYFKVYGRRAMARKELGNLKGSMKDIEYALKLKPDNQEMKNQYAEIKSLLVKASSGEHEHDHDHGGAAGDKQMESEERAG